MIGLDTNVLVRFLVQDDVAQGRAAKDLIGSCTQDAPGYIPREVMVELVWVLERAYNLGRESVAAALDGLLGATEIVVEDADRVARAVHYYAQDGFDFADQMIASAAHQAGCETLYTFDKKASKASGVSLIE